MVLVCDVGGAAGLSDAHAELRRVFPGTKLVEARGAPSTTGASGEALRDETLEVPSHPAAVLTES